MFRITREGVQRRLFLERTFYVGLRREWARGSKAIFVKRLASGDSFTGSGIIERFIPLNGLKESERKICSENNWNGKILFAIVIKFIPPIGVSIRSDGLRSLQTGQEISDAEIERISAAAETRVIS